MAKKCCICGKDEHHVNLLFKGKDDAYICDACIDRCTKALEKARTDGRANLLKPTIESSKLMTPAQIKARLDEDRMTQRRRSQLLFIITIKE